MLGATRSGEEPWQQLASALGADRLLRLRQVHRAGVVQAGAALPPEPPEGDIVLAGCDGPAIAVQGADCVPLLVADARRGVVAAAHAGWRGLVQGVPRETVEAMGRAFGSKPEDLIAAIGPSIGACCYEVGPDVRAAFAEAGFPEHQRAAWFHAVPQPTPRNRSLAGLPPETRAGHAYFDGWSSATAQLERSGVPRASIFCAGLCTASHPEWLCSYRRDQSYAGRIAGAIVPRASVR